MKNNKGKSSNYRELEHPVETVRFTVQEEELDGVEIYLCINDPVAEGKFFNGLFSSKLLFELILRLKNMELGNKLNLQFVHITRTRMVEQGADGLS